MKCKMILGTKIFIDDDGNDQTTPVSIFWNRISTLSPDYWNDAPVFRVEYYDIEDRYDKVIYILAEFKVIEKEV